MSPPISLPSSVHCRWKSKHLHELSPAFLLPGSLAVCILSSLLILSSSLTTQDHPVPFSGTGNRNVLHHLMVRATVQHLQLHASFHLHWEELKGSSACLLDEILVTVGKFIAKSGSFHFAEFFWCLAFSTMLPHWLRVMPQGSYSRTLLSTRCP